MTSLEARIARCARQNLQNGQIIFFHFCPETPHFALKWAHFRTFTNQSWRYSKDAACYPVQEEKERIAYRCQIALILPPKWFIFGLLQYQSWSWKQLQTSSHFRFMHTHRCTDDITYSMNSNVCKAEFTKKWPYISFHFCPEMPPFCPQMAHFLTVTKPIM